MKKTGEGNGKGKIQRLPKLPSGCIFKSRGSLLEEAAESLFLSATQHAGLTPFEYCKSQKNCEVTEVCQKDFSAPL